MRILMLTEVFHPDMVGGAGRVAAELARSLVNLGAQVRVVSRTAPRAMEKFEKRDGFEIFRYDADLSNPVSAYRSTHRGVHDALDRALENFHPDILDLHQPLSTLHAFSYASLAGVPAIYTCHSSWADELRVRGKAHALLAPVAAQIEKKVFRHFARVVVLSEFSRRRVSQIDPGARTVIIPGGVDTARFPLKASAPQNDVPVILTIRNLVRRMGIDSLIDAARILKERGRRFFLEIGGTGPLENELRRRAQGMEDCVRFLGHIPEENLAACYQRADLFVLPTMAIEGFGLVILEAFASGTPVIGTPVGAIPELVGLQGHGYVSATPEPDDLTHSIEWFLDRPDKSSPEELRKVAEAHDWNARGLQMMNLYKSLRFR